MTSALNVSAGGMCASTRDPSMPSQANEWCGGHVNWFQESFCVMKRSMPAPRRICGICPLCPNVSGLQNCRHRRPKRDSRKRCP